MHLWCLSLNKILDVMHLSQALEEIPSMPGGPTREVKAECRQREAGPGAHAIIRSVGGVLGCSQAKAKFIDSNQKSTVWISHMRVLSKKHIKKKC